MRLCRVQILLFALGLLSFAFAKPLPPETLMRLDVDGRGVIKILLYTKEAPKTTDHIIDLVKKNFYDGQKFYRVVKTPRPYLVQFGAPDSRTKAMDDPDLPHQGSGTKVSFEGSGHSNDAAGVVGLSTQQGDKDSGDSQFYILLAPAKFLDGNYTVFGKVIEGMDVLKAIEKGDVVSGVTITTSEN